MLPPYRSGANSNLPNCPEPPELPSPLLPPAT
nr:MAG TPA: hypothetical protein [Caudoviricetes sp.]